MIRLFATPIRDLTVDGPHLCGLTWMDGALWFSDGDKGEITAIDPESGAAVARVACPGVATGLTAVAGRPHLMQVVGAEKRLRELHARTGAVVAEYPNPRLSDKLCGLQHTTDGLWMGYKDPSIIECRRGTHLRLATELKVAQNVADLTVIEDVVAFANYRHARIHILVPASGQVVADIEVEGNPTGLTWDGSKLWYCDYTNRQLRAIAVPDLALLREH